MKLTLKKIADIVNGKLLLQKGCTDSFLVNGISTLEEAKEDEITFLGNNKYLHFLKDTKAVAVLVSNKIDISEYKDKNFIIVNDPQLAYGQFLDLIYKEKLSKIKTGISPRAIIEDNVELGSNISVGHNVIIEEGSKIGDDTKILANVYIGKNVSIGKNCIIYPNVTIREDSKIGDDCIINSGAVIGGEGFGFVPMGNTILKKPQLGYVEIGNNVEIGANTTIDRATLPNTKTYIGDNTKIDNLVMIAHNVQIGKNSIIVAQVGIAGSTKIGDKVTLGGQVGIVGHITIGNNIMVGAKSGIMHDLSDNQILSGYPLQSHKEHLKSLAIIKKLPEMYIQLKKIVQKLNI
jgi:UDP-3-O-[3-hydroxymyristoyl] glucosamine N-acyltransferase